MSFRPNTLRTIFLAYLDFIYISSLKKPTVFQDLALAIMDFTVQCHKGRSILTQGLMLLSPALFKPYQEFVLNK